MSQTKYKLPDDLKMRCISIIRGYDRMVLEYHNKRAEIIYSSSAPPDGQPHGNGIGDECFNKTKRLEELEAEYDTDAIRAVEQAKIHIGLDICDELERQRLMSSIWDSCVEGRNFIYEYRNLHVGKTSFYERRRKFLYEIAKTLKFV